MTKTGLNDIGRQLARIGQGKAPRGQKTSRCKKRTIQLHGLQRFRKWIHTPPKPQETVSELDRTSCRAMFLSWTPGKKTRLRIQVKVPSAESDHLRQRPNSIPVLQVEICLASGVKICEWH